jgi:hypothetical protein
MACPTAFKEMVRLPVFGIGEEQTENNNPVVDGRPVGA